MTQEEIADMSVFANKASLRRSMLKTLRSLNETELEEQSRTARVLLFEQDFYKRVKSVGCYLSMTKGELRTNQIVRDLLSEGTKLYTPYIPPQQGLTRPSANDPGASRATAPMKENPAMRLLRVYSFEDLERCPLDKWGIIDPGLLRRDIPGDMEREDVMKDGVEPMDLILIPGVAFDQDCNRLGRGKAYYDRFLLDYANTHPRPLLVALALAPQVLPAGEKIPITSSDFQLDAIISPSGIIWRVTQGATQA